MADAPTKRLLPKTIMLPGADLKKAISLYGLGFGNKLDQLLGTGLKEHTFTYLYGEKVSGSINLLALNSVRYFGGRALFIDAGNSADPYLIRSEADLRNRKDSAKTRKILQSIELCRVFTCHQLANFVIEEVPLFLSRKSDNPIRFLGVSGVDSVFSEEDSSQREISNLQYLIASKLRDIAKDKKNGVLFVVASSKEKCPHFLQDCDVAMETYAEKKSGRERAALVRHPSRLGIELEL
jgi:hypothetical protein